MLAKASPAPSSSVGSVKHASSTHKVEGEEGPKQPRARKARRRREQTWIEGGIIIRSVEALDGTRLVVTFEAFWQEPHDEAGRAVVPCVSRRAGRLVALDGQSSAVVCAIEETAAR